MKANIQRPRVTFAGARLDGLSLEAVDLLFDLKISNPNPVGIKLAGFDYDFLLNGSGFVHGEQDRALEIPAHGENIVQIPLSLRFAEVYKTFKSLRDQDTTRYQINAGVSFELPFLGKQRIPVSKEGTIPLLKLPKLRVESLKLNGLSLSGADLQLNVLLKNPNVFSFTLNRIGYQLEINDKRWMTGDLEKRIQIP
ncbi:MAG: LEA type 2 family protein, partial [bacterium]